MSYRSMRVAEARQQPRLKLPVMYTLVRAKPKGSQRFIWTGHVYDISATGMRLELDEAVEPGTVIEVRTMLPGSVHTTFRASGRVVRIHDDDASLPPVRVGLIFDHFVHAIDRQRLRDYLQTHGLRLAA